MPLTRSLRRVLIRFPGLVRTINRMLPAPLLRHVRSMAEKLKYNAVSEVHDLPAIFHYWSERYVRPLFKEFGDQGPEDFFIRHILSVNDQHALRILSIGAGNCEADLDLVLRIRRSGRENVCYECLEINGQMLERARVNAEELGIADAMVFTQRSVDAWVPDPSAQYQVIVCRQFLHHVVDLEGLTRKLKAAMAPGAVFLVDDMVGRNGHMRWPEALAIVEDLWGDLPEKYKFHHLHEVTNHRFVNWDCSITGFEGIRAQDILPLLNQEFCFREFIAFGNVIEVFVDRPYGPNFDPQDPADLAFIDHVQALDQQAIDEGRIKPTHIIAALQVEAPTSTRCVGAMTPAFAERPVS